MNKSDFYKGKKIFITGHTGFKGTWMIQMLHLMGAHISGYALAPAKNGLFILSNGKELCENNIHDIRNAEKLKEKLLSFQPDIIFHLAAQPLVLDSYEQPAYTFEVNLMGTIHLLEALKELKNKCSVVVITTDKVYQDQNKQKAYKETDPLGGHDPYSASKATVELAVDSYRKSFFNYNL